MPGHTEDEKEKNKKKKKKRKKIAVLSKGEAFDSQGMGKFAYTNPVWVIITK